MKSLYVDWSGDAGFKFREYSSRFLSIACVACSTPFSNILAAIRREYELGKGFHFHFTSASELIKPPFFARLAQADLKGVVVRVDKSKLRSEFHKTRGTDLIGYFIAETVGNLPEGLIEKYVLLFDGSRDEILVTRTIRIAVSIKLRAMGRPLPKKVAPRPAHEEDGLQVADMLAGAAASEHLSDNVLLGYLRGKVSLIDYSEEK